MFEPKQVSLGCAEITVTAAEGGEGTGITQRFEGAESVTVTCTCTSDGKTYSTTKTCPSGNNNTCDCSSPTNPRIICG